MHKKKKQKKNKKKNNKKTKTKSNKLKTKQNRKTPSKPDSFSTEKHSANILGSIRKEQHRKVHLLKVISISRQDLESIFISNSEYSVRFSSFIMAKRLVPTGVQRMKRLKRNHKMKSKGLFGQ